DDPPRRAGYGYHGYFENAEGRTSNPERTKIFESGKEETRKGQRVKNSLGSRSGSVAAVTFYLLSRKSFSSIPVFLIQNDLRVLRGEDCFGDDAAATDAKRRPGFQTWSPRRPLPDPCYLCNLRFSGPPASCLFVSISG